MTSKANSDHHLQTAQQLDLADPLRTFRTEFSFPKNPDGTDKLYFCGNSLGLQHQSVALAIEEVLSSWSARAVEGHFTGEHRWLTYHEGLRAGQAEMIGAGEQDVATMNTLTANLHLAMISFYRPQGPRRRILIEKHAFPSDRYAVESQIRLHGLDPADCLVELAPEEGQRLIQEDRIESCLRHSGDTIALVLWPSVQYATGQAFDLGRIAAAARACGANVGFDLAHGIGNIPLSLKDSGCDFAAWCTYKYLNAGPGSVGGMYIDARHHGRSDLPRLNGWFGNELDTRFRMAAEFRPAAGADAWQLSTHTTLAMAPLRASLEVFKRAGFATLRKKSVAMTGWLATRIEEELGEELEVITPLQAERRGCQLSLRVRAGREVGRKLFEHLEQQGVVPDWREPDVIRVSPVPLYNSYQDCAQLVHIIRRWADPDRR